MDFNISYLNVDEKIIFEELVANLENQVLLKAIELLVNIKVPITSIEALLCYQTGSETENEHVQVMVERLGKLELSEQIIANPENEKNVYRELFITLGNSIDVIIVKLALELSFLQVNKTKRDEESVQIVAKLAQDIYAPLCHRLGLGEFKTEFEDLSLYILNEEMFFDIAKKLQLKKDRRDAYITEMISAIKLEVDSYVDNYQIFGRSKHIYSIYNKIVKFNKQYEQLFDLLAIRIICQTEDECYTILGLIHQMFVPLDKRFKDYIARPKPNMYQSLHTSVYGIDDQVFEIQIRTEQMDKIAELGVAAHFEYKNGKALNTNVTKQLTNLKNFVSESEFEAEDYKKILEQNILENNIYAFTPQRKIISLPIGGTVVDFAFKIHSKVGEQMTGAIVNGKIVKFSHKLETNDVVEILTKSNAAGPNETWYDYCITPHAKSKIKSYLRKKAEIENEATYERGLEMIKAEAKKRNLDPRFLDDNKRKNEILREFKANSIYDLYEAVANHKISVNEIVTLASAPKEVKQTKNIKFVKETTNKNDVIIPGAIDIKYELSKCCNPIAGDEIGARAKTGVAFKIHRIDCQELGLNYMPALWNLTADGAHKYNVKIKIVAINNDRLLNDIINILSTVNVGVVNFKKSQSTDLITMTMTLSVSGLEQLELAIANMKKNSLIKEIQRT